VNEYATAQVAAAFIGHPSVAARLSRSIVSGPMVFAGLGQLLLADPTRVHRAHRGPLAWTPAST
jgi:hypothetical protein